MICPTDKPRRGARRGITLVELVIVTGLMSLATVWMVGMVGNLASKNEQQLRAFEANTSLNNAFGRIGKDLQKATHVYQNIGPSPTNETQQILDKIRVNASKAQGTLTAAAGHLPDAATKAVFMQIPEGSTPIDRFTNIVPDQSQYLWKEQEKFSGFKQLQKQNEFPKVARWDRFQIQQLAGDTKRKQGQWFQYKTYDRWYDFGLYAKWRQWKITKKFYDYHTEAQWFKFKRQEKNYTYRQQAQWEHFHYGKRNARYRAEAHWFTYINKAANRLMVAIGDGTEEITAFGDMWKLYNFPGVTYPEGNGTGDLGWRGVDFYTFYNPAVSSGAQFWWEGGYNSSYWSGPPGAAFGYVNTFVQPWYNATSGWWNWWGWGDTCWWTNICQIKPFLPPPAATAGTDFGPSNSNQYGSLGGWNQANPSGGNYLKFYAGKWQQITGEYNWYPDKIDLCTVYRNLFSDFTLGGWSTYLYFFCSYNTGPSDVGHGTFQNLRPNTLPEWDGATSNTPGRFARFLDQTDVRTTSSERVIRRTKAVISMKELAFNPTALTVPVGTTVTWSNDEANAYVIHDVYLRLRNWSDWWNTSDVDSGPLRPRQTFSYTFTKAGSFSFYCTFHPEMTGQINVVNFNVDIQGNTIKPQDLTIKTGATIYWTNRDLRVHSVTARTTADGIPVYDANGQPYLDANGNCRAQTDQPGSWISSPDPSPSVDPSPSASASDPPSPSPTASASASPSASPYTLQRAADRLLAYFIGEPARAQSGDPCAGASLFDSGDIGANGGTFQFTFTQAGTYEYFCKYHPSMPSMHAKITVIDPVPDASPSPEPVKEKPGGAGAAVSMTNFRYNPQSITVKANQDVVFTNDELPDFRYDIHINSGWWAGNSGGWQPKKVMVPEGATITWYNDGRSWWGSENHDVTSRIDADGILIYDNNGNRVVDGAGNPVGGAPLYYGYLCASSAGWDWYSCWNWGSNHPYYSYTFNKAGIYKYFCSLHGGRPEEYGEIQVGTRHTVTSDEVDSNGMPVYDSGPIEHNPSSWWSQTVSNRKTWTHTFKDPGTYNFHCQFHPWMKGAIKVEPASPNPSPTPNPLTGDATVQMPDSQMGAMPNRYSEMSVPIPQYFGSLQIPVNIEWDGNAPGHSAKVYMVRDDGSITGFDLTDIRDPGDNNNYWQGRGAVYWRNGRDDLNQAPPANRSTFKGTSIPTGRPALPNCCGWGGRQDIGGTYLLEFTYDGQFMRARIVNYTGWFTAPGNFTKLSISSNIYWYYSSGSGPGSINTHVGNAMISTSTLKSYQGRLFTNPNNTTDSTYYYSDLTSRNNTQDASTYTNFYLSRAWAPPNVDDGWGASNSPWPVKVDGSDYGFDTLVKGNVAFNPKDMAQQMVAFPQATRSDFTDYVLYSRYNPIWTIWDTGGFLWWQVFYQQHLQQQYTSGTYYQYQPGYMHYFVLPPAPQSAITPMTIETPLGEEDVLSGLGRIDVVGLYNPVTQQCEDNINARVGRGRRNSMFRWHCGLRDYGALLGYTTVDPNIAGNDARVFRWTDRAADGAELHHWRYAKNPFVWWDGDPPDMSTLMSIGSNYYLLQAMTPRGRPSTNGYWWDLDQQWVFNGWTTDWYDYVQTIGMTLPPSDNVVHVSNRTPNYFQIVGDTPTQYIWGVFTNCYQTWNWWWWGNNTVCDRYAYLTDVKVMSPYRRPLQPNESLAPRGFYSAPGEYYAATGNGEWNKQWYDNFFAKITDTETGFQYIPGESIIRDNGWQDYHLGDPEWHLTADISVPRGQLVAGEDVIGQPYNQPPLTQGNRRECYVPNVHIDSETDNNQRRYVDYGWWGGNTDQQNLTICDPPYRSDMPDVGLRHTRDYQRRWVMGDTADQVWMKSLEAGGQLSTLTKPTDSLNPFFMFGYYTDTDTDGKRLVKVCRLVPWGWWWWGARLECSFEPQSQANIYYKVDPETAEIIDFANVTTSDPQNFRTVGYWYDYFPTYSQGPKSYSTPTSCSGGDPNCAYRYLGGPSQFGQFAGYIFGNNQSRPNSKWLNVGPVDNGKNGWYDYDVYRPSPGPIYQLPTDTPSPSVATVVYDRWLNLGNPPDPGQPPNNSGPPGPKHDIWLPRTTTPDKYAHVPGGASRDNALDRPQDILTNSNLLFKEPPRAGRPPWPPPWYPDQDHAIDYYGPSWYNYAGSDMYNVWTSEGLDRYMGITWWGRTWTEKFWFFAEVDDSGNVSYPWWNSYYRWAPGNRKSMLPPGTDELKTHHWDLDPLGGIYWEINSRSDGDEDHFVPPTGFQYTPDGSGNVIFTITKQGDEVCPANNGQRLGPPAWPSSGPLVLPYFRNTDDGSGITLPQFRVDAGGAPSPAWLPSPPPGSDPIKIGADNTSCPGDSRYPLRSPTTIAVHPDYVNTTGPDGGPSLASDGKPLPYMKGTPFGDGFSTLPGLDIDEYRNNGTMQNLVSNYIQRYPGASRKPGQIQVCDTGWSWNPWGWCWWFQVITVGEGSKFPYGHWEPNTATPDYFQIGVGNYVPTPASPAPFNITSDAGCSVATPCSVYNPYNQSIRTVPWAGGGLGFNRTAVVVNDGTNAMYDPNQPQSGLGMPNGYNYVQEGGSQYFSWLYQQILGDTTNSKVVPNGGNYSKTPYGWLNVNNTSPRFLGPLAGPSAENPSPPRPIPAVPVLDENPPPEDVAIAQYPYYRWVDMSGEPKP